MQKTEEFSSTAVHAYDHAQFFLLHRVNTHTALLCVSRNAPTESAGTSCRGVAGGIKRLGPEADHMYDQYLHSPPHHHGAAFY